MGISLKFAIMLVAVSLGIMQTEKHALINIMTNPPSPARNYPLHQRITTTVFWVGETASNENAYIPNHESCWDEHWLEHYGGIDDPDRRDGFYPADFIPKENPFYFALPYSDFDEEGRKANAYQVIPWATEGRGSEGESLCKNRWIRISYAGKSVYAQWEDGGPFGLDDIDYVFGTAGPRNKINHHAGLDVSPAVRDYLGLSGEDTADWQFIDEPDVPDGPWKQIVTTSQIYWEE